MTRLLRTLLPALLACTPAFAGTEPVNEHMMDPWFARSDIELQRASDRDDWSLEYRYLGGPDDHKLLLQFDAESAGGRLHEADTDLLYARPVGDWGLFKAGANYRQRPSHAWRAAIGHEYLLPGFVHTDITVYAGAGHWETVLELERPTALGNRLTAYPGIEARHASRGDRAQETGHGWYRLEPYFRLEWRLGPRLQLYGEYRLEKALGDARRHHRAAGEDPDQHRGNLGLRLMF